jgi:flagellar hook protein FlgE
MKKTKLTNVRGHKRNVGKKLVNVSRHIRHTIIDVDVISKAEYRKEFKKRPIANQNRDKARTKINTIPKNKDSYEFRKGWTSKKYDWMGIDAGGIEKVKPVKMPKQLSHKQSTRYDDAMYDKKAYHDSSLNRHENDVLEKERTSFRGMSHMLR